jgi:type VI secretion system VasD/TssJ family lipoprotein
MRTGTLLAFLGLAVSYGLLGCRKKPPSVVVAPQPPPAPALAYVPQGLLLTIRAEPDLNVQDDQPHALLVVLYQLNGVNAFNQLAKDPAGLQTLLKGGHFDASVASVDRLFLQPGQELAQPLDRAQQVQWLGVAAGYYGLGPGGCARLVQLPETAPQGGVRQPEISLVLGRDAIRNAAWIRPLDAR